MISRLYQLRYNLPESKLINTDEFARKIPQIPRLAATNGYYSYEGEVGKLLACGAPDSSWRATRSISRCPGITSSPSGSREPSRS